jgi:hypothetical protein
MCGNWFYSRNSDPMFPVQVVVEGLTDEYVVRTILKYAGLICEKVQHKSKPQLPMSITRYNQAAQYRNWLVVLDLDHDAACAVTYRQRLLAHQTPGFQLRIAVRAIEAWLLADQERIAAYLGVSRQRIPVYPDQLDNPKATLIELVRHSPNKKLREDMATPPDKHPNQIGPGYAARILEFVEHAEDLWRPDVAAENSDSLARCIRALQNWQPIPKDSP